MVMLGIPSRRGFGIATRPCCHRRLLGSSSRASAMRRKAVQLGAPPTVGAVLDDAELLLSRNKEYDTNGGKNQHTNSKKSWQESRLASPTIRQVGSTRRVYLPSPYLLPRQLEGLAYRIKVLTKNDSLSSILISSDETLTEEGIESTPINPDDNDPFLSFCLPSSLLDRNSKYARNESVIDPGFPPQPGFTYHFMSGYDPTSSQTIPSTSIDRDQTIHDLLTHMTSLATAMRGDSQQTKIPTIVMPHGMVRNAGYALLQATYVLATRETSFQITTPRQGLTLDPVGLSYSLPRLGREFQQPSQNYPCGMILALTGYQANVEDCMETGIATHYVETPTILGELENALAQLPPWNQQTIVKNPIRYQGQSSYYLQQDLNREHRNVAVAETLHCFCDYHASGNDVWVYDDTLDLEDPSVDTDPLPWHEDRESDLLNYAATFADIFNEPTLVGVYDRLREVASAAASTEQPSKNDPQENEGAIVAHELVSRMEQASPLALHLTHRLLKLGARSTETFQSCLEREHRVQAKLLRQGPDFATWLATTTSSSTNVKPKWQHASLRDVSANEVAEWLED